MQSWNEWIVRNCTYSHQCWKVWMKRKSVTKAHVPCWARRVPLDAGPWQWTEVISSTVSRCRPKRPHILTVGADNLTLNTGMVGIVLVIICTGFSPIFALELMDLPECWVGTTASRWENASAGCTTYIRDLRNPCPLKEILFTTIPEPSDL